MLRVIWSFDDLNSSTFVPKYMNNWVKQCCSLRLGTIRTDLLVKVIRLKLSLNCMKINFSLIYIKSHFLMKHIDINLI